MGHDNAGGTDDADASSAASVWSKQEKRLLKQAIKDFPAELDKNERFRSVAKAVGGCHNKKDCYGKCPVRAALGNLISEHAQHHSC
jgi:hypothetical protein